MTDREQQLEEALRRLALKTKWVLEHPSVKGTFIMAAAHGAQYDGPTIEPEMSEALRILGFDALSEPEYPETTRRFGRIPKDDPDFDLDAACEDESLFPEVVKIKPIDWQDFKAKRPDTDWMMIPGSHEPIDGGEYERWMNQRASSDVGKTADTSASVVEAAEAYIDNPTSNERFDDLEHAVEHHRQRDVNASDRSRRVDEDRVREIVETGDHVFSSEGKRLAEEVLEHRAREGTLRSHDND